MSECMSDGGIESIEKDRRESMSKFTKRPWNIGLPGGPSGRFWSVVNSDGNVVAMQVTSAANARLISAAPDLLEALKNLSNAYIYKDDEHGSNRFNAQTKAEQAIAKAEAVT